MITWVAPWWMGITVDHLYGTCPVLDRSQAELQRVGWDRVGAGEINPEGGDVCGVVSASVAGPEPAGRVKVYSPRPYEPTDLPAGTRVQGWASGRVGIVQPHCCNLLGTFSVAWLDGTGLWEVVTADDVHVLVEHTAGTDAA